MYQYLHKYFSLYKNLPLQGIGSFNITAQHAQLDFSNKTLHAPFYTINYTNEEPVIEEGFYNFLAKEAGLQYSDAVDQLKQFTMQLTDELKAGGSVQFKGIGTLIKQDESYLFDADIAIQGFFPAITVERVIRQNAEHNVRVGEDHKTSTQMQQQLTQIKVKEERWWIAAIVLAVVGIVAIAYYYYAK